MVELIIVILVVGILALIALPKVKEDHLYEAVDQIVALIRYTQQLAIQDNLYNPNDPNWFKKRWGIQLANCQEAQNQFGLVELPFGLTVFKETNPGGTPRPIFAKDPANPSAFLYSGYRPILYSSVYPMRCDLSKFNKKLNISQKGVRTIHHEPFLGKLKSKVWVEGTNPMGIKFSGELSILPQNCTVAGGRGITLLFDELGRPHYPATSRPYGGDIPHCGATNMVATSAGYIFERFKIVLTGRKQFAIIYIEGETGFVHVKYYDNPITNAHVEWDANGY